MLQVPYLLQEVPEFEEIYREHLRDQEEVLPHVLFGDLTRFFLRHYELSQSNAPETRPSRIIIEKILRLLESAIISSDQGLRELVLVSFLENLDCLDNRCEELLRLLGPNLLAAVKA